MAAVVPSIFNAALTGFVAGMMTTRPNIDPTSGDYAAFTAAGVVFATAFDIAIGADATLAGAGATVVPATAANANSGETRPSLALSLCTAYWSGKSLNGTAADLAAGTYTVAIAAIKAQYVNVLASFSLL